MARPRRTAAAVLPALLVGLLAAGCDTVRSTTQDPGPQQTQTRPIGAVSAVVLAASGELSLTSGAAPSLRITAGRNVIDHLTSEVHGERLTLGSDRSARVVGPVRYDLVLPAARDVELSGSGTVHVVAAGALQHVLLPGSGQVRIDGLDTEELTVDLSGSGQVAVAGRTTRQRISIEGSGQYSAAGLTSQDADVTISGSGSADVAAGRTLHVTVSGSGSVFYTGDPELTRTITGSGAVVRR